MSRANHADNLLGCTTTASGFRVTQLCGVTLAADGPACTQGPAVLVTTTGRFEGAALTCSRVRRTQTGVEARFQIAGGRLEWRITWRPDPATGVVSRRDTLVNTGRKPEVITRCLARVALPRGRYECYTQTSRWCRENQGAWQPLRTGITMRHASGRTTLGGTPYLAVRAHGGNDGLACHVLPRGNWTIHVNPVADGGDHPYAVVELGLADDNLRRVLRPGERFALPEILFQSLPEGEPHRGAPAWHRYLLAHHLAGAKPAAPVVYNTWFHEFEVLDVPRLRAQLGAAKQVGCEVFVVDAGWFGPDGVNWWLSCGDWREKPGTAFAGRLRAFADEVRAAGLGFGLWMEPERFAPAAPVRVAHPDWFVPVGGDMARLDLTRADASAWLRGEIRRLVRTYRLAWMKIDFNFALDADASGAELADYAAAWHRLVDELRAAHPATFFEGCSSGAMRGDLATLSHFDGHFLSDTVNPVDMLRITQGAWLRLPPGRLTRWAVVRSAGQIIPRYGKSVADSPATVLTPAGALWEPAVSVDLDLALWAAVPGMFGLSGDLASLCAADRARVTAVTGFYKEWRGFITGAVAHLLTPPEPLDQREGCVVLQLRHPVDPRSLVFVYRLGAAPAGGRWRLAGLEPRTRYVVRRALDANPPPRTESGEHWMTAGLEAGADVAAVYTVIPRADARPKKTKPV